MSDARETLHGWIDGHAGEIVESLRNVLRIPSVKQPPAGPTAPYGAPIREALDTTLALCAKLGFRIKDVGGHAGHAEFGAGDEMVAAVGHLDVVPEGDGWRHPPFSAELEDGFIYARGSSDDKGPTYAALFAAKALMDSGLALRKRVRVIFGCDEEAGFGCVKHYWEVAKEERPALAFTPDAMFPLIYAEKGISNLVFEKTIDGDAPVVVSDVRAGTASNVVPHEATALLTGSPSGLYAAVVALHDYWDGNVTVEPTTDGVRVTARGKAAHASTPRLGDNAIERLARALVTAGLTRDRAWLAWVRRASDTAGVGLGIAGSDDVAGDLTSNAAKLELKDGIVRLTVNIRYPVTWTFEDLIGRAEPKAAEAGWTIASHTDSPPLYVPLDSEPTKTLLRVYREETGDEETQPGTMGGGTYARATPNAVAFGAAFPDSRDGPAHQVNERIAVDTVIRAAKVYAVALYELAK